MPIRRRAVTRIELLLVIAIILIALLLSHNVASHRRYTGEVHSLLCDSRFVSENMDLITWRSVGSDDFCDRNT